MKKIISAIIASLLALSSFSVFADSSEILINGENAVIGEGMGSVVNQNDRTFVPIRFALEYFGYEVTWSSEDRLVLGRNADGNVFVMQVGSPRLIFNSGNGASTTVDMDVSPFLNETEGRTYIPLRFLAQVLGYNVGYNEASSTVTLDKK